MSEKTTRFDDGPAKLILGGEAIGKPIVIAEWNFRELAIHFSEVLDEREHSKIIGSKIISFYFEPIPNRKTMQNLIINTDTISLRIRCKLGKLGNVVDSPFIPRS